MKSQDDDKMTDAPESVAQTAEQNLSKGELVGISLKAVAVTLSVVMLILSILTVAMPLSAMRVFNKLGMEERALHSGEQYISTRLKSYDGDETDSLGNVLALSGSIELSDDDMTEALNMCVALSDRLLRKSAASGDERDAVYFAKQLELNTRRYASLSGIGQINAERSELNVANVPSIVMRPFVYDYTHTNLVLNYRARVYTGETDYMLIDNVAGDNIRSISDLAGSYGGIVLSPGASYSVGNIDRYVDYIGQLGAYLDIKLTELGVTGNLTESEAGENFKDVMRGTEFELFADKVNGMSGVYKYLSGQIGTSPFKAYAKAAVDYVPTTLDDRLHQLFWLSEFAEVSTRLYYLGMLLYYNHDMYGQKASEVKEEYDDLHAMRWVQVGGETQVNPDGETVPKETLLPEIYEAKLREYIAIFA